MKYPTVQNFINGEFISAATNRLLPVISPVNGQLLSEVPLSGAAELEKAVTAATAAFHGWSKTPIKERVQVFCHSL